MAATSHPAATLAALDILRMGGNAVDAAVCAAALQGVVEPTQTGIGGDCFALIMRDAGTITALNGSGWSPARIDPERIRASGLREIPVESATAVTIPGAVRAWETLLSDHGSMELERVLQPAIRAAEDGYPVLERLAYDWRRQQQKLSRNAAAAAVFLPGGEPPQVGARHRQPQLAKTLRAIAARGAAEFYCGATTQRMVETLTALGGAHSIDDFETYRAEYVDPLSARYRDYQLWECPPNGQGLVPLIMASMLDRFDMSQYGPVSVERFHLQAEVARLAYAQRDSFIGDPRHVAMDIDGLLGAPYIDALVKRISLTKRMADIAPRPAPRHKDTVFIAVVDRDGTAVALINSIFDDFGSGIVCPHSGVLFHNRGSSFVLESGHPNALAPRKRPLNTIIPGMLARNGQPVMPFGVTGGHFQPSGQLQLLGNLLDHGLPVQQAVDLPRMFARGDSFEVERAVPESVIAGLQALGHGVTRCSHPLGTAQAIWIDRANGVLRGAADGRRDGLALGY
ncbi:gamma-glutamyltransferase [Pigmentiphaga soli]|uniref:Glutathione hydrolase proenzyme n=2 Tax=Pigmentiphaga soli TaxID=1007095 RepID=A0ABP8GGF1_9BURK